MADGDTFDFDPSRVIPALHAQGDELAQLINEKIQPYAPVYQPKSADDPRVGGALKAGLKGTVVEAHDAGLKIGETSDQDYAKYVVNPTGKYGPNGEYPIEVRNARFLRFWDDGGDLVFRKIVMHPGSPANPFYHQADDEVKEVVRGAVGQALRAAMHP